MGAAVVTGAGSGIGRATAEHLARRGLDVALLGRTEAALQETAARISEGSGGGGGGRALVLPCDVSKAGDVARAAAEVLRAFGAPVLVVNNAGIVGKIARIEELSEEDWDEVMGANLKSVFLVTRAFLPAMVGAGRGRFVTVASISATLGTPRLSAYVASKWGATGFTKSLAEELRGKGLQALSVLPGSVDTPMLAISKFPSQMGPEAVANVIAYAGLDAPEAMNGSSIEVFGP